MDDVPISFIVVFSGKDINIGMEVVTDEKDGLYLENLEEYIYDDEKIVRALRFLISII